MASEPPKSLTKDTSTHHTSPVGNVPQKPLTPIPKRVVTGTVSKRTVPMHVTKHPNPVGRPKTLATDTDRDEGGRKVSRAKDKDKDEY